MRMLASLFLFVLLIASGGESASACAYTPLEWQQPVRKHSNRALVGQRKHTTWIRDRDRDFIDDEIRSRFGSDAAIDIVVELNKCVPVAQVAQRFRGYGRVTFVSRSVTFVLLSGVRVKLLPQLAAQADVAMIEWQPPGHFTTDVAARAVQARASKTYLAEGSARQRGFTGKGVNVAIVDTGVDDVFSESGVVRRHEAFPQGTFHKGFSGLKFDDSNNNNQKDDSCDPAPFGDGDCTDPEDEPGLGQTNPEDTDGHGTLVAGVALGGPSPTEHCSDPAAPDNVLPGNCEGVAPGARLIDVEIYPSYEELHEALAWIERMSDEIAFDVVNISMAFCLVDYTGALPQTVNRLVALGIVVVASHGNANRCDYDVDTQISLPPGSSSSAITVAASHDLDTVTRSDDVHYANRLRGPRSDFNFASPSVDALKPDLAAPGSNVLAAQYKTTNEYSSAAGTSVATPFVAGAAAIILEARPTIDPVSLKELLRSTADQQQNGEEFTDDPAYPGGWESRFGSGLLDLEAALKASETDVTFPTCVGPAATTGVPCPLTPPLPNWSNTVDVRTSSNPRVDVATTIEVDVKNVGPVAATVSVTFGVYTFAIGNRQFHPIGVVSVNVPAGGTVQVSHPWTPIAADHHCLQASIGFGLDSEYRNNVTQRNIQVAPSVYNVQIENPFVTPARISLEARWQREDWQCHLSESSFMLDSRNEGPRTIQVEFDAPPGTPAGESADCEISATATRRGHAPVPIGGVTVRSFVPKPCRIVGMVVDRYGKALPAATLALRAADAGNRAAADRRRAVEGRDTVLRTSEDGIFEGVLTPHVLQEITIAKDGIGRGQVTTRLQCGTSGQRFVLTRDAVTVSDY